ncbi:MAG: response regulator [Anaerolineae bacterium]|nr:response regulator [Anaerolineae bacterium]
MTTVLIVEDEANIRKFVVVNLTARGYDVVEVDNARDGLERLRRDLPDLLLLDIKMPGMSGLELLEIISREQPISGIPVIVMTASEGVADSVEESSYPQIVEVLVKPVSVHRLVEVVSETLSES